MLRSILCYVFSAVLLLSVAGTSVAASKTVTSPVLANIVKTGELRVGMSGDQPPLNFRSKSGKILGLEADLARILAQAMEVKPKFVTIPFSQLLTALERGEIDMVMSGMTITPKRNLRVAFVGPYFVSGKSILTKSAQIATAREASDINNPTITIATLKGSTSQTFVENVLPKVNLITTSNYEEAVDLVRQGAVDAMVADAPICMLSVLRYKDEKLAASVTPLTVEPIGIALPNDPLFMNLVQNYLTAVQGTKVLDRLHKVWFKSGAWLKELP